MDNETKRKAMDAIASKETHSQIRALRGHAALGGAVPAPRAGPAYGAVAEVKRQAMDAIRSAETLAQIGALKLTGGIALYVARIRQMDGPNRREKTQARTLATSRKEHLER